MANEIRLGYRTGLTVYAVVQNDLGQYWRTDTTVFENFNVANWTSYDITMTETGATGVYLGTFPVAIVTAGYYGVQAYRQLGGSPAVTDIVVGDETLAWTGSAVAEILSSAGITDVVWAEALPESYTAGQAGYILGTNLNATVSSRASQASVDTIDDFLDTEIAAILAAVDTEVAAIKAKTDNLPASPAAVGSAMTLAADSITATALATSAVDEITDSVWAEALPGAYSAGQAGKIVGDNLNATVSSRATQTSVDTIDDFLDTEIAAILAAVDTEVAAIKAKTDLIPASPAAVGSAMTLEAATIDQIIDEVWDEARSGHTTAGTFGEEAQLIRSNTAQAGAAGSITLDASASAVTDFYKDQRIHLIAGTGALQARVITAYDGTTKVATVSPNWATNPSSDSQFIIVPFGQAPVVDPWSISLPGSYSAGQAGKIVGDNLNATVSSRATQTSVDTIDDFLDTEIAAIKAKTDLIPASPAAVGSAMTLEAATIDQIIDEVWDEARSGHTTVGTFGESNQVSRSNTAQAGGANTITLDASASAVNDYYNNQLISIVAGTGAGQTRIISDYVGATKVATVSLNWGTNPASDSQFIITAFGLAPEVVIGDVWATIVPGAYAAGTAGYTLGTNLNATITSRASQTSVDTVDDFLDSEVAAIKAKTDLIPASPAAVGSAMTLAADSITAAVIAADAGAEIADAVWDEVITTGHSTANSAGKIVADNLNATVSSRATQTSVDTIDDFLDTEIAAILAAVDTEVAAIKAKTDLIPASPAAVGSAMTLAADALDATSLAASAVAEIADGVWDEARSGHTTAGTFGEAAQIIRSNTAQAGAAGTITLDTGASAVTDFYLNALIFVVAGTGAGQSRIISAYNGTTKVATLNANWATNPANDSQFVIFPSGLAPVSDPWATSLPGAYGAGTAGKIVGDNINATISSRASQTSVDTIDDFLDTEIAAILAAVDTEIAAIKAKTDNLPASPAAVGSAMTLAADSITATALATSAVDEIVDAIWDEVITTGHAVANSAGKIVADNLNATVSSRATQTSVDTIDDFLDTEIAAILASVDTEVAAILAAVDTEVAAIKAKTDNLPANPAAVGSAMTLAADSITAAALATSAVDEIVDAVWTEALPGSYTAGQAGYILGTNLNATVSSRATQTSVDTIDDYLDTELAAILAAVDTEIAAILAAVDTEVAAIKAKTDLIPASPAAVGSAMTLAADALDATALAASAIAEIADGVWDEARSGHTTAGTFGESAQIIRSGTAQAGAAGTITLDAGASGATDFYANAEIQIISGTGTGQTRIISAYNGTTKVASVATNWVTNPSNDSQFVIRPFGLSPSISDPWGISLPGSYSSGTAGYILGTNLNATVSSRSSQTSVDTIDDFLDTEIAAILAAVDTEIAAIKAKTDLIPASPAAVGSAMTLAADALTSTALATSAVDEIVDAVWDEIITSGHAVAGSSGKIVADNLNATVSSRATQTSVDTIDDFLDTEIAAILAAVDTEVAAILAAVDTEVAAIKAKTDNLPANPAAVGSAMTLAADSITAAALATSAVDEIVDAVWNEPRVGHTTAGTFGESAQVIRSATAQGGTTNTVTLDSSASAVPDLYVNAEIQIIEGTGIGQSRIISAYNGTTKIATVSSNWAVVPSTDSQFVIRPFGLGPTVNDPWTTSLPGSYSSGQAGYILGTNLNATVSSRASQTSVDTIDDFLDTEIAAILALIDTEIAAIKAKTDNLPASPAAVGSAMTLANDSITSNVLEVSAVAEIVDGVWAKLLSGGFTTGQAGYILGTNLDSTVSSRASQTSVDTIDDFLDTEIAAILAAVDTEVAAIKAKTDNLPASPAAVGSAMTLTAPTIDQIVDEVWDETLADHQTAGSTGAALDDSISTGDPWSTLLPGAYGAGTAGKIVGDNINATISSRATQTSVDTIDDFLDTEIAAILALIDTEIAAIKAKTDNLPASPAAVGSAMTLEANSVTSTALATSAVDEIIDSVWAELLPGAYTAGQAGYILGTNLNATVSSRATQTSVDTIDDFLDTEIAAILAAVDTEIAAIKAKTDNLPASPAAVGSPMTLEADSITSAVLAASAGSELASVIDSVLSAAHGAGAWTESISGPGANSVTLTVRDEDSNVLPNIKLTVKNNAQTSVLAIGETDVNGQVTFGLNDGTYKVIVTSNVFYEAVPAQTLIVSGTTTATYTLESRVPPDPSAPGLCSVYLDAFTGSGEPAEDIILYAEPEFAPMYTSSVLVLLQQLEATTNVAGRATLALIRKDQITSQNKRYRITCVELGINIAVEIPNQDTVDIRTLL